jgi:hypothetical protein
MFQQLFERSHSLNRQLTGPLLEERLRYLHHCAQQGFVSSTLREIAIYQLVVIRYLHLTNQRKVSLPEIETAAVRWARRRSKLYGKAPIAISRMMAASRSLSCQVSRRFKKSGM